MPRASEWKAIEHRIRVGRAKNKCETCGKSHNSYEVEGKNIDRIKLKVIHLDDDPTNNADGNLLAVCQFCESKRDSILPKNQARLF